MDKKLLSETSATIVEQGNYIAEVAEVLESGTQASIIVSAKFLKRLFHDLNEQNTTILQAVYGFKGLNNDFINKLLEQTADLLSDTTSDLNDIEKLLKKHGSPYTLSTIKTLEEAREALVMQHMELLKIVLKNTKSEVSR